VRAWAALRYHMKSFAVIPVMAERARRLAGRSHCPVCWP